MKLQVSDNHLPKYCQLKQILVGLIKKNHIPADKPFLSERQLVRQYSLSKSTVHLAVNELVKEGILKSVYGKGLYIDNHARAIAEKEDMVLTPSNNRIALIFTNVIDEFCNNILRGISDVVSEKGYKIDIFNTDELYRRENQLLANCLRQKNAGVIMTPSHYELHYRHILKLQKEKVPVILVDRNIKHLDLDFVASDNIKGAEEAVCHLIKHGHKKIVFLGRSGDVSSHQERLQGYRNALEKNGIKYNPELVINEGQGTEPSGYKQMNKLLSKKTVFTAVFTMTDYTAIGAYKALKSKKIRVPEDVAIIGFDNMSYGKYLEVPLTSVEQQTYEMGRKGAEIFLQRVNGIISEPQKVLLPTKLVIKQSCGCK
jgi:DNA-binding LacI/PurR family transcriptional regulator